MVLACFICEQSLLRYDARMLCLRACCKRMRPICEGLSFLPHCFLADSHPSVSESCRAHTRAHTLVWPATSWPRLQPPPQDLHSNDDEQCYCMPCSCSCYTPCCTHSLFLHALLLPHALLVLQCPAAMMPSLNASCGTQLKLWHTHLWRWSSPHRQ